MKKKKFNKKKVNDKNLSLNFMLNQIIKKTVLLKIN